MCIVILLCFISSLHIQSQIIDFNKDSIKVENLGEQINTSKMDYSPTLLESSGVLFFTSNRNGNDDFWFSQIDSNNNFSEPQLIDNYFYCKELSFNSVKNEGGLYIHPSGKIIATVLCNRKYGMGDCDIFISKIKNDTIIATNYYPNTLSTPVWESSPCINIDGTRIYFASNRTIGSKNKNNLDLNLFYSDWDPVVKAFAQPIELSDLNTYKSEISPFICPDDVTIIFASKGWKPNYGGYDLYVSRYDPTTKKWSTPENLGESINTSEDDMFPFLTADGLTLYFSSKRKNPKNYGDLDIFKATLPGSFLKDF